MSDSKTAKAEKVTLKSKSKKSVSRQFGTKQANALLKLPNSQWELDDKNYQFNGTELAKASK